MRKTSAMTRQVHIPKEITVKIDITTAHNIRLSSGSELKPLHTCTTVACRRCIPYRRNLVQRF